LRADHRAYAGRLDPNSLRSPGSWLIGPVLIIVGEVVAASAMPPIARLPVAA
jgi:hypothetical protein